MKPRIDISNKNSLTIWESGNWNDTDKVGRSTIIAGPTGEKLAVIYDSPPDRSNFQYLFFANPEQLVATAFLRSLGVNRFKIDLELSRIKSLHIVPIQGHETPKSELETIWALKQVGTDVKELARRAFKSNDSPLRDTYLQLIEAAIDKALTVPKDQKLFWGVPRPSNGNRSNA